MVLLLLLAVGCRKLPIAGKSAGPARPSPPPASLPEPVAALAAAAPVPPVPPVLDQQAARQAQVVVLGYHRFVDTVRHPDTEITPAQFQAQMDNLKASGITVISLADFLAWKRGEKSIPARSALITIDDGYRSGYSVAWPILKKSGFPFTLFIYTDYVKGGRKSGGESLTWAELGEMRDAGVSIQSHTVSHRDLRGGARQKAAAGKPALDSPYEQWLWEELHGSKAMLESQLGIKVCALALPYGASNPHVREVALKAGYEVLFNVDGQKLDLSTPNDRLGRYIVESNKPETFTAALTQSPGSAAPAVTGLTASMLKARPADRQVIGDASPLIEASLEAMGSIDPQSLIMRISGLGPVPARYDPKSKIIAFQPGDKLRPAEYTVIVSAQSEGRKIEGRWSFTVEAPPPKSPPE